ncbi:MULTISPECIES: peptide chain release factor N(5)-glutamine methyltransferase [unclassified Hyphomonas]|uniref:peptide chain release factor N(5)-glutamine methyltransferase n=1 Tax=unclassified Hyphomonas TaxID=2630699 RepID=UPI0021112928|nr:MULTISPECIES: peptide chain release factor N(5)-glutamine methyltransferase [unclassified Hyphomonas]
MAEGAAQLRKAGIDTSRLEARWLLAHAAGCQSSDLIARGGGNVSDEINSAYSNSILRRAAREPLQHIIGSTEFFGLEFLSDGRALIPRPDSEILVEAALARIPDNAPVFIADLGTGSGCLLSAILANRPLATGEGVEASQDAAELAEENLSRLGLSDRASIHNGPWSDWQKWGAADLIISNPPYIVSAEMAGLMPEVRDHDPAAALDGGPDGLNAYREIVGLAAGRMKPGGWLVFEIGYDQRLSVGALLETAGFEAITCLKDLGGNDRAIAAQHPVV